MRIYTIIYWLKNIIGAICLVVGLWMFLFFEPSKSNIEILRNHSQIISLSLFPLGAVIVAGLENLTRMLVGLVICLIGILSLGYFVNHRDTWIGQLITNFGAPAMVLCGMLVMLLFNNKPKRR